MAALKDLGDCVGGHEWLRLRACVVHRIWDRGSKLDLRFRNWDVRDKGSKTWDLEY